jgi:hypothetical protein
VTNTCNAGTHVMSAMIETSLFMLMKRHDGTPEKILLALPEVIEASYMGALQLALDHPEEAYQIFGDVREARSRHGPPTGLPMEEIRDVLRTVQPHGLNDNGHN